MNSNTRNRILLLAFTFITSCSSALYIPTSSDADRTGISTERLMTGRTLYINKCGSCHNLHLPEQYTGKRWIQEMTGMQKKAKISDEEARQITDFLLARCKQE